MIRTSIDTTTLRKIIKKSGYKTEYLAKMLEIRRSSFNRKVAGGTEFRIGEILRLCSLLDIDKPTREKIFHI